MPDVSSGATDVYSGNLTGYTYKRGAHNVISHPVTISYPACGTWYQSLFAGLSVGYTIQEAMQQADNAIYDRYEVVFGNLNVRHFLGDASFLFYFPSSSASSLSVASDDSSMELNAFSVDIQPLVQESKLQKISGESTFSQNDSYNVYKDVENNLYTTRADNGMLEMYQPNTQGLQLGDTIVDATAAKQNANAFLAANGYDVSDFALSHSNDFSKTFKITYQYMLGDMETAEKLVMYYQAEEDGTVHLIQFAAYNYGMFSSDNTFTPSPADYSALLPSLEQAAAVKSKGDTDCMSQPQWVKNGSGGFQLQAWVAYHDANGNSQEERVYSNLF